MTRAVSSSLRRTKYPAAMGRSEKSCHAIYRAPDSRPRPGKYKKEATAGRPRERKTLSSVTDPGNFLPHPKAENPAIWRLHGWTWACSHTSPSLQGARAPKQSWAFRLTELPGRHGRACPGHAPRGVSVKTLKRCSKEMDRFAALAACCRQIKSAARSWSASHSGRPARRSGSPPRRPSAPRRIPAVVPATSASLLAARERRHPAKRA